jgi:hypothetical protein
VDGGCSRTSDNIRFGISGCRVLIGSGLIAFVDVWITQLGLLENLRYAIL